MIPRKQQRLTVFGLWLLKLHTRNAEAETRTNNSEVSRAQYLSRGICPPPFYLLS